MNQSESERVVAVVRSTISRELAAVKAGKVSVMHTYNEATLARTGADKVTNPVRPEAFAAVVEYLRDRLETNFTLLNLTKPRGRKPKADKPYQRPTEEAKPA